MQIDYPPTIWAPPPDTFILQSHQVHVWRIPLDLPAATVKSLESTLSADERERAARFRLPGGRERYIAAHGSLRDILARYLDCGTGQFQFSKNEYGKPALSNRVLEFNLSHSGDLALVAVTRGRNIGVDVERIRTELERDKIAGRFFSPNEVSELMAFAPVQRDLAFFNCWTRKEAYIKARGLGLSLSLDSFDVSLGEPAVLRATRPDPDEAARWTLLSLEVAPGYTAAVAVEGQGLELRLWEWSRGMPHLNER